MRDLVIGILSCIVALVCAVGMIMAGAEKSSISPTGMQALGAAVIFFLLLGIAFVFHFYKFKRRPQNSGADF